MTFKKNDYALMTQYDTDQLVQILTEEDDGNVQIKNKGTYSPCPVEYLCLPWVLTDPDGEDVDSKGPIFVKPDGQTTNKLEEAQLFRSPESAEEFRDQHTRIGYFIPKPYNDFVSL
tara:strand:- start:18307 stop:18654 length:348 start_codon:yes stop_codon:yes gene_type:complete